MVLHICDSRCWRFEAKNIQIYAAQFIIAASAISQLHAAVFVLLNHALNIACIQARTIDLFAQVAYEIRIPCRFFFLNFRVHFFSPLSTIDTVILSSLHPRMAPYFLSSKYEQDKSSPTAPQNREIFFRRFDLQQGSWIGAFTYRFDAIPHGSAHYRHAILKPILGCCSVLIAVCQPQNLARARTTCPPDMPRIPRAVVCAD